jgi:hypothetical protein
MSDWGRNSSKRPERIAPPKRKGSPSSRMLRKAYWKSEKLKWNQAVDRVTEELYPRNGESHPVEKQKAPTDYSGGAF